MHFGRKKYSSPDQEAYATPAFISLNLTTRSNPNLSSGPVLPDDRLGGSIRADRSPVLEGTVADPSGRVIAGASLKILAVDTGITQERQANASGYYRFPGLAVGHYTVT